MKKILSYVLNWLAPLGYEDENGFHFGEPEPKDFIFEVDWSNIDEE